MKKNYRRPEPITVALSVCLAIMTFAALLSAHRIGVYRSKSETWQGAYLNIVTNAEIVIRK